MTIYHKLNTLLRMTRESTNLRSELTMRAKVNLGQLRVRLAQERSFIYRTGFGFRFVCIPGSQTSSHLYFNGSSEELEMRIAGSWAQPGDACVDVGANVGYYTALLADRVGSEGCVLAVEPAPHTFALLREAVEMLRLPQVRLENICVSDVSRPVEFMCAAADVDSVFQSMSVGQTQAASFTKALVQAETLNSLIEAHELSGNVSLVKIDIEGAEPLALRGASALFKEESLPLFIVEINQSSLRNFGYSPADTTSHFPPHLFDAYLINFNYWEPQQRFRYGAPYAWRPEADELPDICNFIFAPRVGKYRDRWSRIAALLADTGNPKMSVAQPSSNGASLS